MGSCRKDSNTVNYFDENIKSLCFYAVCTDYLRFCKSGQRVKRIFELINTVMKNYTLRVKTSMLNDLVEEATAIAEPPSIKGRKLKIFYAVQAGIKPPTFIFFVNDNKLFHFSYVRYLENVIRQTFDFEGTPIIIKSRERKGSSQ